MGAFIERQSVWTGSVTKAKAKDPRGICDRGLRSLRQPPGSMILLRMAESPEKFRAIPLGLLLTALMIATPVRAADQPFKPSEAKTTKPDLMGRTRTELRDSSGRKVGDAVTTKPNLLGDTRTVVRDASGKSLGEAVTRKPDLVGQSRTTFKDPSGKTLGQGVTTQPDLLGRTRTRFTDPNGRMLGEAVTTKPGLLGETRTTIRGGTPWNPGTTSSGKSTTLTPATQSPPTTRKQ